MEDRQPRLPPWGWAALVGAVALLPFARGLLSGGTLYLRDLGWQFIPLRLYALAGLRLGEVREWNPYVHEGILSSLPPVGYPVDLLQLLRPDAQGVSLVLALHLPLAAICFLALAARLGVTGAPAAIGSLAYALGGFAVSSVNLYAQVQALAWAPLVVATLWSAAEGGRRQVAVAALVTGVSIQTTGLEIVAQAVALAVLLALGPDLARRGARLACALLLAGGLSATVLARLRLLVAGSEREAGFPPDVVLAHPLHPITYLQVIVGDLHGDLSDHANTYWGSNWTGDYPYILSIYLGVLVVSLAAAGLLLGGRPARRPALAALLAALVSLGARAGMEGLVEAVSVLRSVRYPSKAFFTVHICLALLAALGASALAAGARRGWRTVGWIALPVGAVLSVLPLAPLVIPGGARSFAAWFFPGSYPEGLRMACLEALAGDAALGGTVALAGGGIAVLVLRRALTPQVATALLAALCGADLVRTASGVNPMVAPSFLEPSAGMAPVADRIRREGGRVFTCTTWGSRGLFWARQFRHGRHETWAAAAAIDTLSPFGNLAWEIPTAYSIDVTMLVPASQLLYADETACGELFPDIVDRLRKAGVAHVLSLDPLRHPDLAEREVVEPPRLAPLRVFVYALRDPLPLRAVPGGRLVSAREAPGRIEIEARAERPTTVVVRDTFAPGWTATVDDQPAPVLLADGRHRAVPIGAGSHRVVLSYVPPYRPWAVGVSLFCALVVGLLLRPRRPAALRTT